MTKIIKILNHPLSEDQITDLKREFENVQIIELPENLKKEVLQSPDNAADIEAVANSICDFIEEQDVHAVLLPAGSPAFNFYFSQKLAKLPVLKLFSHSVREFKEIPQPDGSIKKVNVFKHKHFIMFD